MTKKIKLRFPAHEIKVTVEIPEQIIEAEVIEESKPEPPEPPADHQIRIAPTGVAGLNGSPIIGYQDTNGGNLTSHPDSGDSLSIDSTGDLVAMQYDRKNEDGTTTKEAWMLWDRESGEMRDSGVVRNGAAVAERFLFCNHSQDYLAFRHGAGQLVVQRVASSLDLHTPYGSQPHFLLPYQITGPKWVDGQEVTVQWRTKATSGAQWQYLVGSCRAPEPLVGGGTQDLYHEFIQWFDTETMELGPGYWIGDKFTDDSGHPITVAAHNHYMGLGGAILSPKDLSIYEAFKDQPRLQHLEHYFSKDGSVIRQIEPGAPGLPNIWTHPAWDKAETGHLMVVGLAQSREFKLVRWTSPDGYELLKEWSAEKVAELFGNKFPARETGYAHGCIHNGKCVVSYQTNQTNPSWLCLLEVDLQTYELRPLVDWYKEDLDLKREFHSMCRQVCAPGFLMWHTEKPVELRSITF